MSEREHPSLTPYKKKDVKTRDLTEEAELVSKEFSESFKQIAESRIALREQEQEIRGLLIALSVKLDSMNELKRENMILEKTVLEKLNRELG